MTLSPTVQLRHGDEQTWKPPGSYVPRHAGETLPDATTIRRYRASDAALNRA